MLAGGGLGSVVETGSGFVPDAHAESANAASQQLSGRSRRQLLLEGVAMLDVEVIDGMELLHVAGGDDIHPPRRALHVLDDVGGARTQDLGRGAQLAGIGSQLTVLCLRLLATLPFDAPPCADSRGDCRSSCEQRQHAANAGDAKDGQQFHGHTAWPSQPAAR